MKSKLLILVAIIGLFAGYVIAAEKGSMQTMDEPTDAVATEGADMANDMGDMGEMGESMNAAAEETVNSVEDMGESMNLMIDTAVEGEVAK